MTRVKICGLRDPEDARVAIDAGADLIGVIFAESPRRATVQQARALRAVAGPRTSLFESDAAAFDAAIARTGRPLLVGVFARQSADEINRVAAAVDLDVVQLSGGEQAELIPRLTRPVIRIHHVDAESTLEDLSARVTEEPASVAGLETKSVRGGGSGRTFDWSLAASLARERSVMLGGGLNPDNIAAAIDAVRPWAVDASSGVESAPAVKDPAKVRALIGNARAATATTGDRG